MHGSVDTGCLCLVLQGKINRFYPTTKTTPYIVEEASTIKNRFSTCRLQLLSLHCCLTAIAFVKMKREYNLHYKLFKQFRAMISAIVVEK